MKHLGVGLGLLAVVHCECIPGRGTLSLGALFGAMFKVVKRFTSDSAYKTDYSIGPTTSKCWCNNLFALSWSFIDCPNYRPYCIGIRTTCVYFASSRSATTPSSASLTFVKEDGSEDEADEHDTRQAAQPSNRLIHAIDGSFVI